MAEFYFYGTEEDRIEIVNSILAMGDYQLLPDLHYPESQPRVYGHSDPSLFESFARRKKVYIRGPFSKESVFMEELSGGRDDGRFYISETKGGPVLTLVVPGSKAPLGLCELVPGCLSHRAEYWDAALTTPKKASDELKAHYKKILGAIKRHLVRKKVGEIVWVGRTAWELLTQRQAILLANGKWWDGSGGFVRSNLQPGH